MTFRPIGGDVAEFLGRSDDPALATLAGSHLPVVTAMVKAYVHGAGFTGGDPADDLALVIIAATARLTANPELTRESTIDDYSTKRTVFAGWTLPELAVLHNYRRRAA